MQPPPWPAWLMASLRSMILLAAVAALGVTRAGDPPVSASLGPGRLSARVELTCVNECWTAFSGPSLGEPNRMEAIRELGIGALRFPGGTESQAMDLVTGQPVPLERVARVFGAHSNMYKYTQDRLRTNFTQPTLKDFVAFANRLNVTPIWDLNIATATPDGIVAQVGAIQGAQTTYGTFIELGNELYMGYYSNCSVGPGGCSASTSAFPDGAASYLMDIKAATEGLKSWAPPVASTPLTNGRDPGNDSTDWNDGLVKNRTRQFPAVTVHLYAPACNNTWDPNAMTRFRPDQWPSVIAATPGEAIRQTISSLRGTVGGKPGASFPGTPQVWLTETNMGIVDSKSPAACCLVDPPAPRCNCTASANGYITMAYFAPLAMLSKAGYLLAAASTPEVDVLCHHSLQQRGDGPAKAHAASWSRDPFGFVWTKDQGEWPFPDSRPRINSAAQLFARVARAIGASTTMHPLYFEDAPQLKFALYGTQAAVALQGAAFQVATETCYVIMNRDNNSTHSLVLDVVPSSTTNASSLVVPAGSAGTRCTGDGQQCWAPLPDGPVSPEVATTHRIGTGGRELVKLPPLSVSFIFVGMRRVHVNASAGGWCSAFA